MYCTNLNVLPGAETDVLCTYFFLFTDTGQRNLIISPSHWKGETGTEAPFRLLSLLSWQDCFKVGSSHLGGIRGPLSLKELFQELCGALYTHLLPPYQQAEERVTPGRRTYRTKSRQKGWILVFLSFLRTRSNAVAAKSRKSSEC